MRDWEETHPPSFYIHLELWIPKSLDSCENMWNTKQSLCCLLLLPSMQWELNSSIKCRTLKSWSLGNWSWTHQWEGSSQSRGGKGEQFGRQCKHWGKMTKVIGQNHLCKDLEASKRQTYGKIQGNCPYGSWGDKQQKAKGEIKTLPFPSTLMPFLIKGI